MFESMDALAARLASSTPAGPDKTDPFWVFADPVLDPDGSLVDQLVLLERVKSAAEARSMMIMAELCVRAEGWVQPQRGARACDDLDAHHLAAAEVAPALRLAPVTAGIRLDRATRIVARLPGTLRAFAAGLIDIGRIRAIYDATEFLSAENAAKVEAIVLGDASDQTAGELRAALCAAVIAVDPDAAETRRKAAVKGRSVRRYARPDGMSALEAVLSAIDSGEIHDLVDDIARASKTTGDTRSLDARRADAFVFLLLGRDPQLGPEDPPDDNRPPHSEGPIQTPPDEERRAPTDAEEPPDPYDDAGKPADDPDVSGPASGGPDLAGECDELNGQCDGQCDRSEPADREDETAGAEHGQAGPDDHSGAVGTPYGEHDPAGPQGVPNEAQDFGGEHDGARECDAEHDDLHETGGEEHPPAGRGEKPPGSGSSDGDTADLAKDETVAAREQSAPANHNQPAVAVRAYEDDEVPWPEEPDDLDDRFPPRGTPMSEPVGEPARHVSELVALCMAALCARCAPALPWVAFASIDGPNGPVTTAYLQGEGPITAQWGQHLLDTGAARPPPDIAAAAAALTPEQKLRHDPPLALTEAIRARDGTCRHPGCRRAAHRCDEDHTIRFPEGLTVPENLSALCRRHHRVKHEGGWTLRQTADAALIWTSRLGRIYTTRPRGPEGICRGTTDGSVDTAVQKIARAA